MPNGSAHDSLALDGNGDGTLAVTSLGHMNDQQPGSVLPLLRVAIHSGDTWRYVSLLSAEQYTELAANYVDHLHPNAPAINVAGLLNPARVAGGSSPVLDFFISPAHAFFDVSLSDIGSEIGEAISWIVPYEDVVELSKQLYYKAKGDPQYDPAELALATAGTLTIIPVLKPFKLALKPLKKMLRYAKEINPKFVESFGSVVGQATKKAWDTKSTRVLFDMLPFLVIAGELMADDASREGLVVIIKSVRSDDDLWAWIDYLRLPDDGWYGSEAEIPELELAAAPTHPGFMDQPFMVAGTHLLNWMVPTAEATPLTKGARIAKAKLLKLLRSVRNLDRNLSDGSLDGLIDGIKGVTQAMKKTNVRSLRKLAFNRQTVVAAMAIGSGAIRKLIDRARNLRMSPLTIAAIVTYLETRRGECPDGNTVCRTLDNRVDRKLNALYKRIFTESLVHSNVDYIYGTRENGALFHLAMLALKHFEYEVVHGGDSAYKVLDIESNFNVQLYKWDAAGAFTKFGEPHGRRMDIVLAGEAGNVTLNNKARWVEVKSYKRPPNSKYFQPWKLSSDKSYPNHRQFFLDRVGVSSHGTTEPLANDFEW